MPKRFLYSLIFSLLGVFALTGVTHANGVDMRISPVSNYFYIKAGSVQNYSFTITNNGDAPFVYQLYASPYSVTDSDYTMDFNETENKYNQITRWISFKSTAGSYTTNPQYSIEPGESQTIYYRISVPDSIPEGGQYCVIFAETVRDNRNTSSGITTISRVALSVVGHGSGETIETAELTDHYISAPITTHGIKAAASVKNTGNTDFELSYLYQVKSIFDKELYADNASYTVLPETERRFTLAWEEAPLMGIYKARLAVVAADLNFDETKIVVILPIWLMIIVLILLTIIIIWIIILIRKRKDNSTRLVV